MFQLMMLYLNNSLNSLKRWLLYITVIIFVCCNQVTPKSSKLLATVGDKSLYEEDLPLWVIDSTATIDMRETYIDKWIRSETMLAAAESQVGGSFDLDELVQNYKESLLMHNFEKFLVKNHMDSLVSESQIQNYYDENKEEFVLDEHAVSALLLRCNAESDLSNLKSAWKKNKSTLDFSQYQSICDLVWDQRYSWVRESSLNSMLPESVRKKISWTKESSLEINNDNVQYFVFLRDIIEPSNSAPVSLVKENIIKLILHKRKKTLMKEYEEKLVQEGIKNKQISLVKE